jgi:hypothetical protein
MHPLNRLADSLEFELFAEACRFDRALEGSLEINSRGHPEY